MTRSVFMAFNHYSTTPDTSLLHLPLDLPCKIRMDQNKILVYTLILIACMMSHKQHLAASCLPRDAKDCFLEGYICVEGFYFVPSIKILDVSKLTAFAAKKPNYQHFLPFTQYFEKFSSTGMLILRFVWFMVKYINLYPQAQSH